jgi:membrane carboxypeptidase/penicillin-binding protein
VEVAIRAYQEERFFFNEAYRVTATLSSSIATIAMTAIGTRFYDFDRVRLLRSTGNYIDLYQRDYDWVMSRQDAVTYTQPAEWCLYNETVHFDSNADQAYAIVFDGLKSLGSTATDSYSVSSSVSWFSTSGARELIRHRARRELYMHVLKDNDLAAAAKMAEDDAYDTLKTRTNARTSTGFLRPTEF